MDTVEQHLQKDVSAIAQIPIIENLLDVVCRTTGMGFAAIARVTEDRWIACSVHDTISFGMVPGDELAIKTTICNEIRQREAAVVINNVSEDPHYHDHHTPAMYGFKSYISVPIVRKDGRFFGTLCAIDPAPHDLDIPEVRGMFDLFADLIAFHLYAAEQVDEVESTLVSERKVHRQQHEDQQVFTKELEKKVAERTKALKTANEELEKMNKDLQSFAYISSHDLQEPLRKIQTFAAMIEDKEFDSLSDKGKHYLKRMRNAADRMQNLIRDLLTYSHTGLDRRKFEDTDLNDLVELVKEDLEEEILMSGAVITSSELCSVSVIRFQFQQLLQNLISNSLKFAHPDRPLKIDISGSIVSESPLRNSTTPAGQQYCHIRVEDNGIGFDQQYGYKIFELFQRLHGTGDYNGTGIGLSIVKKIVENHSGMIMAIGETGKGARFEIYLPVE